MACGHGRKEIVRAERRHRLIQDRLDVSTVPLVQADEVAQHVTRPRGPGARETRQEEIALAKSQHPGPEQHVPLGRRARPHLAYSSRVQSVELPVGCHRRLERERRGRETLLSPAPRLVDPVSSSARQDVLGMPRDVVRVAPSRCHRGRRRRSPASTGYRWRRAEARPPRASSGAPGSPSQADGKKNTSDATRSRATSLRLLVSAHTRANPEPIDPALDVVTKRPAADEQAVGP